MRPERPRPRLLRLALLLAAVATPSLAQADDGGGLPGQPHQRQSTPGEQVFRSEGPDTWRRANLLGDPFGVRSAMAARGVVLRASDVDEFLGNPVGGLERTGVYEGLTRLGLRIDAEKAFNLKGGEFAVTAYQIRGRGLSADGLGSNLLTASSIEAQRSTRLAQLWYEQSLAGGKVKVRAGQLLADLEFMTSAYGGLFVNSTFGWPGYAAANLPSGGPAYPDGALGVRVMAQPSDAVTLLAAVFDGDPNGPAPALGGPPNPSGTAFRSRDGVFAITELQYSANMGKTAAGPPGVYKLGVWYNSDKVAGPLNGGPLRPRRGDWSVYAVADQHLWSRRDDPNQGLSAFARVMGGPDDRNVVNIYLDAGLVFKGLLPGRARDTVGLGFAAARYSDAVAAADRIAVGTGAVQPIRRGEQVIELSYQAVVAPWLQVQPFSEVVLNPTDTVPATHAGRPDRNALVFGVRTNTEF